VTTTVLFPLLSHSHANNIDKFQKIYSSAFKYMGLIIIPIAIGTTFLSKAIVYLVFGNNFIDGSFSLSVLMWAEIFVFLGTVFSEVMTAAGVQKYLAYFTVVSAILSITFNYVLIPHMGINGASIATLIAYSGGPVLILQYFLPKTRLFSKAYLKSFILPILYSIPMVCFLVLFPSINVILSIIIGATVYLTTLILTKGIGKEEFGLIRSLFFAKNNIEATTKETE
jgi:O-antigen/teichoic acid export membrane protein